MSDTSHYNNNNDVMTMKNIENSNDNSFIAYLLQMLPISLVIQEIFPYLDRISWNNFSCTCLELYQATSGTKLDTTTTLPPWPTVLSTGQKNIVWSVSSSFDGKLIAAGCEKSQIRIWHVQFGPLPYFQYERFSRGDVRCVEFCPPTPKQEEDNNKNQFYYYLASITQRGTTICIWRIPFYDPLKKYNHDDDFTEEHNLYYTRRYPDVPQIISPWREIPNVSTNLSDHVHCMAWLTHSHHYDPVRSSMTLAAGCQNGHIRIWSNINDNDDQDPEVKHQCIRRTVLEGHEKCVSNVLFVSETILTSSSWDYTIKIWNIEVISCLYTIQGHCGKVTSLANYHLNYKAHRNGVISLVSCGLDCTIKLWNVSLFPHKDNESCELVNIRSLGHQYPLIAVTLLPVFYDYKTSTNTIMTKPLIVACGPSSIHVWKPNNNNDIDKYNDETGINKSIHGGSIGVASLTTVPTSQQSLIATGSRKGTVHLLNLNQSTLHS